MITSTRNMFSEILTSLLICIETKILKNFFKFSSKIFPKNFLTLERLVVEYHRSTRFDDQTR